MRKRQKERKRQEPVEEKQLLTAPTLLEMAGYADHQELSHARLNQRIRKWVGQIEGVRFILVEH